MLLSSQRGGAGAEGAEGAEPRTEEVLAAARGDEPRLRREEEGRSALDRHLVRAAPVGDEEVLVVGEPERVAVLDPDPLDQLELARDARVEAREDEAAVDAVVIEHALRQRRAVGAHAAGD